MARAAGSAASWLLLGGLAGAVVLQPFACSGSGDTGTGPGAAGSEAAVAYLGAVGGVVQDQLWSFEQALLSLDEALAAWSAAVEAGGDGLTERSVAHEAFEQAMAAWQRLEVMQIGALASSLEGSPGAEDLRDEIYSWPTINTCRVDQETVARGFEEADFFTENLANAYGLDALEFLLWAGSDTVCPGQVPPASDGSWDALGEQGVKQGRAAYALALNQHLLGLTGELASTWETFGDELTLDGSGVYESEQEALDAVYRALFYLETSVKDRKLAQPLGLIDCSEALCPDDVESLPSGLGAEDIYWNLVGFEALFTIDGESTGLDDVLAELGHGDLAEQLLADLGAAQEAASNVDRPFDESVELRTESVQALYDAVKLVTDTLKGDVATVLSLAIPDDAAGDND